MPLVTGQLTDFGYDPLDGHNPTLIFQPASPGVSGTSLLTSKPVEVTPEHNGYFEADLRAASAIYPATHYRITIEWTDDPGRRRRRETLPWKLFVPAAGGALADLLRVPENPDLAPGVEPPVPADWWHAEMTDTLAAAVDELEASTAARATTEGSDLNLALAAAIADETLPLRRRAYGLTVRNRAKLARWETALASAGSSPAWATVLGDSITWGVGSDDTASGTSADPWAAYRQNAYSVILRKLLSRAHGLPVAENFIGLAPAYGYATLGGAPARSASLGPFGQFTGGAYGGYNMGAAHTATIPAAKSGRFTALDVLYWGTASGVATPSIPTITIDGVQRYAGQLGNAPGNLGAQTVAGLPDSTHEILLGGLSTSNNYLFGLVTRFASGIVVNRIGAPGATTTDATGGTQTGAGKQRNIDGAVLRGYSDLVVIALGTNDHGQQIPIETYKTNLQALIDAAVGGGACVLLLGEPPAATASTTAIPEDAYRQAMSDLSDLNDHVAYTDTRALFGDRATAYADGLFPTSGTVHPSRLGHEVMGRALFDALPLAAV